MKRCRSWGLALALAAVAGATGAEELVDGIAAQVGSDIVLISEVRNAAGPIEAKMQTAGAPPEEIAQLRADVLEGLVERALIRQLVRRGELGATDAEVDQAIKSIAAENRLTSQQLQAMVEAQGLSFVAYRERIRGEVEHNRVINGMVASKVRVSEDELRAMFKEGFADQPTGGTEVHLRHLLVPFTSDDTSQHHAACAEVEKAREEVLGGSDFAAVAAKLSAHNPGQGGDLGWLHADSLASWMGPVVAQLSPGETSPVLRTGFGCNLLQLVERRGYVPLSYEQVRDQLYARVFQERMQLEYMAFIEKLREQTYVERKGLFADAARLGGTSAGPPGSMGLGESAP